MANVKVLNVPDIRSVKDLKGKRVLLRASLNVPLQAGTVTSDFRLAHALATMEYLLEEGVALVVMGHLGREGDTLLPVYEHLQKFIPISFSYTLEEARKNTKPGEATLLENIRSFEGEEDDGEVFAQALASLGDIYVNDAFADSHRMHASIVGVTRCLPSFAGALFLEEVEHLSKALTPISPALCILGGAKLETKVPLIRKFLPVYDKVFVGGALANDLFRGQGLSIGRSLASETPLEVADVVAHKNLMLPEDIVVVHADGSTAVVGPEDVGGGDSILDIGPASVERLVKRAQKSSFVLWNGPLGNFERGFKEPTEALAKALSQLSVPTIVGGGDTIAAITSLKLIDKFTFVSTAGGAMLEFLEAGTLPGIEALKNSK
jgi:phosphoglycerate kinase